jgi:hypothetical protein
MTNAPISPVAAPKATDARTEDVDVRAAGAAVLRMIQGLHISRAVYVAANLSQRRLQPSGNNFASALIGKGGVCQRTAKGLVQVAWRRSNERISVGFAGRKSCPQAAIYTAETVTGVPAGTGCRDLTSPIAFAQMLQGLARRISPGSEMGVRPKPMAIELPSGQ